MAVNQSFQTLVVEQLGRVATRLHARRMFGGVGLYEGELFFALIADDALFMKVDDATRGAYLARGMPPFRPYGEGGAAMGYHRLPEELLEDAEALAPWVADAIEVARRARATRAAKRR